jgi:hypothetical protein
MTDEVKVVETDAKTALADTKSAIAKLGADEKSATGWVKTHYLIIAAAAAFILGWATRFIHT